MLYSNKDYLLNKVVFISEKLRSLSGDIISNIVYDAKLQKQEKEYDQGMGGRN